jgi:hypothetical protein
VAASEEEIMVHRMRGPGEGVSEARSVIGTVVLAGFAVASAHEAGVGNVLRARQQRAEARRDAYVSAELDNARRLADALAAERRENARLRLLLAQRQSYIDSLRA